MIYTKEELKTNNYDFSTGNFYATAGVAERMRYDRGFARHVQASIGRYLRCDWGDTCKEDKLENDYALTHGERILAEYRDEAHDDWRIWIITEWDRSATTVLFPEEY